MRKNKKKRKMVKSRDDETRVVIEYYQYPFLLLHQLLHQLNFKFGDFPSIRESFWSVVPNGLYPPDKGRELVLAYQARVENELKEILASHSIAYWLHAYRRIAPEPCGLNKTAYTIYLTRKSLEAAIQKYGKYELCDRIAMSNAVPEETILNGMLLESRLSFIREKLKECPQLVLTKFGVDELIELYYAEKLAYEIWQTMATVRILGKGASLEVSESLYKYSDSGQINRPFFTDNRSAALERLVRIYDNRRRLFDTSMTGTVFDSYNTDGMILLPQYNTKRTAFSAYKKMFKFLKLKVKWDVQPNFIWGTINLKQYIEVHKPFEEDFKKLKGISLNSALSVISALCLFASSKWNDPEDSSVISCWQRAYTPISKDNLIEIIKAFLPHAIAAWNPGADPNEIDIEKSLQLLCLDDDKRSKIDIGLGGPFSVLLPYFKDKYFVDFAWLIEILYSMFVGINPLEQNFKGDQLEQLVRKGGSILPHGPCTALDGTQKQIDASYELGDLIVIVECKARGQSLGFERGDPSAIAHRAKLIDESLQEVDDKGRWLSANPVGRNFNIKKYKRILPLVVSPFVEYIGSLSTYYWIKEELSRVLTPSELRQALDDRNFARIAANSPNIISVREG